MYPYSQVKFSLQENEDEEEEEDWGDEESFEKECERPAKKGKNVNFASSLCRYDRTTLPTEGQSSRSAKRPPQPRESRHMPPNRASINISWNNFCNQFRGPLSKLTLGGGKTAATTPEPIGLGSEDCYVGSQPVVQSVQYKHPTYEDMRPCVAFVSSEECMRSIDSEVSNK